MSKLLRGLAAGYGAKKLGGGCFSTILIFILLWVLLGQRNATLPPPPDAAPAEVGAVERPAPLELGAPAAPRAPQAALAASAP